MGFLNKLMGREQPPRPEVATGGPTNQERVHNSFTRSGAEREQYLADQARQMRQEAEARNSAQKDANQEAA